MDDGQEKDIKTTVHCIGLFLPYEKVGPCLIMMGRDTKSNIYCVWLTKETADMVSPLYEHTVILHRLVSYSVASKLAHFVDESVFSVVDRRGCASRLDDQYTKKELEKKLIALLGSTLFIEMDRCYSAQPEPNPLMKPFFSDWSHSPFTYAFLDCVNNETDAALLQEYMTIYGEASTKKYRGKKTLYDNYWKEINTKKVKQHAEPVLRAIDQLLMFEHKDKEYQKGHIVPVFKGWKDYKAISQYFIYRVQGMEQTYSLYKMLKHAPELMTLLYSSSYDNRVHLLKFCLLLKRLISTSSQTSTLSLTRQDFPPLSFFDEVFGGHLYTLMGTLIGQHQPEEEQDSIADKMTHPVLSFLIMLKLEVIGHNKAVHARATLEPIVVQNAFAAYHSLVTVGKPPKLTGETTFELEESDDDFTGVLIKLYELIGQEALKPTGKTLTRWYLKNNKPHLLKSNTPLFYYSPDTDTLTLEEHNGLICEKYIQGTACTELCRHSEKPITESAWQDEWDAFKETTNYETQKYDFILFSASEIKQNQDLECIKTLLFASLETTVILREISDVFFHRRLAHYFAETQNELKMEVFHQKCSIETSQFGAIPSRAVKETLIIPQAHNLSLVALKHIIQIMVHYEKTIKRVVFIGSVSILPLAEKGQSFIDLLRALHTKEIAASLYNKEERGREFATLLQENWQTVKCDSYHQLYASQQQQLQQQQLAYSSKKKQKCILYHLKRQDFLFEHLPETPNPKHPLIVFCLSKKGMGVRGRAKNWLYDSMSAKQKASKSFQSMEIEELARHDAIGKENSVFIMSKKTLLFLDKNDVIQLFLLLDCLYVTESDAGDGEASIEEGKSRKSKDLLECVIESFINNKRPNMRYSHVALIK